MWIDAAVARCGGLVAVYGLCRMRYKKPTREGTREAVMGMNVWLGGYFTSVRPSSMACSLRGMRW